MKKIGITIISIIIATVVAFISSALVRYEKVDFCHTYGKAGFPLTFTEMLLDQPDKEQCFPFALSKAHPTYNFGNFAIDWTVYYILSVAGLAVIGKKKHHPINPLNDKQINSK